MTPFLVSGCLCPSRRRFRLRVSLPNDACCLTASLTPRTPLTMLASARTLHVCIGLLSICSRSLLLVSSPGEPGNHRGPHGQERSTEQGTFTSVVSPPAAPQLPCSPLEMKQWGSLSSGNGAPLGPPLRAGSASLTAYLPPQEGDRPCPPGFPASEHCLPK